MDIHGDTYSRMVSFVCRKDDTWECLNGGTKVNESSCECNRALWTGNYCQYPVCFNSQTTDNQTRCNCNDNFDGIHCEFGKVYLNQFDKYFNLS